MSSVQQYREQRRRHQALGKFHTAHFPIGTIVEVESPFNKNPLPMEQRNHPDEIYGRNVETVAGIISNGPNSWLIQLASKSDLTEALDATNIDWVRRIISRGNGTLLPKDQAVVDQIKRDRAELFKRRGWKDPNPTQLQLLSAPTYNNSYGIFDLRHFLNCYINEHPQYRTNGISDHLIDFDRLYELVSIQFPQFRPVIIGFKVHSINKKRFARVVKAAYAKSKTSRRKAEQLEALENQEQYEREFNFMYGDE